eukprot:TRINITY_DN7470_c0_g1_i1.p1 TRINITY_DN7470_c0_g1~~TRINITY_DN7470_c0_g1_i1.p1  ORF type:complete len:225 (-),score=94.13 TRINITY_DN7470_c0_g1_i1:57-731(-)
MSSGKIVVSDLGEKSYWQSRYSKQQNVLINFEWFMITFQQISTFIEPFIDPTKAILDIGCGNSGFGEELVNMGCRNVTAADYCEQLIIKRNEMNERKEQLNYCVADVLKLNETFEAQSFDIVIDKGLLDALDCCDNDENATSKAINQIAQVLCSNGKYILISCRDPKRRLYDFGIDICSSSSSIDNSNHQVNFLFSLLQTFEIPKSITTQNTPDKQFLFILQKN